MHAAHLQWLAGAYSQVLVVFFKNSLRNIPAAELQNICLTHGRYKAAKIKYVFTVAGVFLVWLFVCFYIYQKTKGEICCKLMGSFLQFSKEIF